MEPQYRRVVATSLALNTFIKAEEIADDFHAVGDSDDRFGPCDLRKYGEVFVLLEEYDKAFVRYFPWKTRLIIFMQQHEYDVHSENLPVCIVPIELNHTIEYNDWWCIGIETP